MTSHLESTKDFANERMKQLKIVFKKMSEVPPSTTVIFAGDTNLRDQEVGMLVCACMEGTRPIMVEIQALVAPTPYGMPRRTAVGFDYNRVNMLLAILEKRLGLDMGAQDAYVNVVGGLKVTEPAADLAVAAALASSFKNRSIDQFTLAVGEVGLTGEVRRVSHLARRLKDAANLGFTKFVVPYGADVEGLKGNFPGIIAVRSLQEALKALSI